MPCFCLNLGALLDSVSYNISWIEGDKSYENPAATFIKKLPTLFPLAPYLAEMRTLLCPEIINCFTMLNLVQTLTVCTFHQ